jgi:hypothetical protein
MVSALFYSTNNSHRRKVKHEKNSSVDDGQILSCHWVYFQNNFEIVYCSLAKGIK